MAKIPPGIEPVADELLQRLDVGKAALALADPDEHALVLDPEDPAGAGLQRHLAQILGEGREQLLRHPGGAQQPLALPAIGDGDARLAGLCHGSSYSTIPSALRRPIAAASSPWAVSNSSVCSPGPGGGETGPAGVRLKRGAGAGWGIPASSIKLSRAWLCGWTGASSIASTGAKQASLPSMSSHHSSLVLAVILSAMALLRRGHCATSFWIRASSAGSSRRFRSSAKNCGSM